MNNLALKRRRLVRWATPALFAVALLLPTSAAAAPNPASTCGAAAGQGTAALAAQLDGLGSVAHLAAQAGVLPEMVHTALCQA